MAEERDYETLRRRELLEELHSIVITRSDLTEHLHDLKQAIAETQDAIAVLDKQQRQIEGIFRRRSEACAGEVLAAVQALGAEERRIWDLFSEFCSETKAGYYDQPGLVLQFCKKAHLAPGTEDLLYRVLAPATDQVEDAEASRRTHLSNVLVFARRHPDRD